MQRSTCIIETLIFLRIGTSQIARHFGGRDEGHRDQTFIHLLRSDCQSSAGVLIRNAAGNIRNSSVQARLDITGRSR